MALRATSPATRSLRMGLLVSTGWHLLLLGALGVDAVWPYLGIVFAAHDPPRHAIELKSQSLARDDGDAVVGMNPADSPTLRLSRTPQEPTAFPSELVELGLVGQSPNPGPASDRHPADVLQQIVDAKVATAIHSAANFGEDDQRTRLKSLAGQLNYVSSERSLDDLAGRFQTWLGTQKRADKPVEGKVAGDFDYSTAQLHDVRRERDERGEIRYISVLVDAAGRKLETILDPVEGASSYKTFQLLKANPLAEMIYRRIAMSLLDDLIKAGQQMQQPLTPEPSK